MRAEEGCARDAPPAGARPRRPARMEPWRGPADDQGPRHHGTTPSAASSGMAGAFPGRAHRGRIAVRAGPWSPIGPPPLHDHARLCIIFLCLRSSPPFPPASASASPSRAASTPRSRSRGCATRVPSRAPTPPTSASTTSPTSPRCPAARRPTVPRSRAWSTAVRRWSRRVWPRSPAGRSTSARAGVPTSTPRRSAAPSREPSWSGRCSRTTSRSGATARPSRATTSSGSTATACSPTRTCGSTSRGWTRTS